MCVITNGKNTAPVGGQRDFIGSVTGLEFTKVAGLFSPVRTSRVAAEEKTARPKVAESANAVPESDGAATLKSKASAAKRLRWRHQTTLPSG